MIATLWNAARDLVITPMRDEHAEQARRLAALAAVAAMIGGDKEPAELAHPLDRRTRRSQAARFRHLKRRSENLSKPRCRHAMDVEEALYLAKRSARAA